MEMEGKINQRSFENVNWDKISHYYVQWYASM
jgi:hypothetical protein